MRVLLTDYFHPYLEEHLTKIGVECVVKPNCSQDQILDLIPNFEGIIIRSKIKVDAALLDHAQHLKFIARAGSGLENVDVRYAQKLGIHVFSSPEANAPAVAEHVLGMLLSLTRNITKSSKQVQDLIWNRDQNWGIALSDLHVGIIGYGHTGSAFAKLLQAFDCPIYVYDKFKDTRNIPNIQSTSLETIQQQCDLISLHIPYSTENHYFVDEKFLQNCEKTPIIINSSRGDILKLSALAKALQNQHIQGACLDVLEFENNGFETAGLNNPIVQQLLQHPNVIITPHIAGWTFTSYQEHSMVLFNKISAFMQSI